MFYEVLIKIFVANADCIKMPEKIPGKYDRICRGFICIWEITRLQDALFFVELLSAGMPGDGDA